MVWEEGIVSRKKKKTMAFNTPQLGSPPFANPIGTAKCGLRNYSTASPLRGGEGGHHEGG